MEPNSIINSEIFGSNLHFEFLLRFLFDVIVIYIIARLIYFRLRENRDYLFTLFILNIIIFFVCFLLSSVTLEIGFAFGIFAIFSILRYRTRPIPIKEMTYMFISISVAVINALGNSDASFFLIIFTNVIIIIFTFVLEKTWVKNELTKNIRYERIELVKPENHEKLLKDLKERTGLNIHRFEVGRIDFLRDIARIKIYYFESEVKNKNGHKF